MIFNIFLQKIIIPLQNLKKTMNKIIITSYIHINLK